MAIIVLVTGCTHGAVTLIRVRSPREVRVVAGDGSTLLPRVTLPVSEEATLGDEQGDVCSGLPRRGFTSTETRVCREIDDSIRFDAYASRHGRCSFDAASETPVWADGTLVIPDDSRSAPLRWTRSNLRVAYRRAVVPGAGDPGRRRCSSPLVFEATFVIPRRSVLSIQRVR
jgi:hypothetical protein